MGKMSDFAIFIDENDLQNKFLEDIINGYFGFDFMNETNPLKDVFMLYCEMEYEQEQEEMEEELKEKYETMQEEKEKEETMLNHLKEMIERNRRKNIEAIIKRADEDAEQGRKEVEMMEKDEETI